MDEANRLAFLKTQPEFQQMHQVVYNSKNPQLIHNVLEQIQHNNPLLLMLIYLNQESFARMLDEPPAYGARSSNTSALVSDAAAATAAAQALAAALSEITLDSPQDREALARKFPRLSGTSGGTATSVQLSPQDREAIDRLKFKLSRISGITLDSSICGGTATSVQVSPQDREAIDQNFYAASYFKDRHGNNNALKSFISKERAVF